MEVLSGASHADLSIEEFLIGVRDAGVGSLAGTAAEVLDDEVRWVRWVLTKGKLPTSAWIEVVTTAHRLGIPAPARSSSSRPSSGRSSAARLSASTVAPQKCLIR